MNQPVVPKKDFAVDAQFNHPMPKQAAGRTRVLRLEYRRRRAFMMPSNLSLLQSSEYKIWLKNLKAKVLQTQLKAAVKVNTTLLQFYWELGEEIVSRQAQSSRGDGFFKQLSRDLIAEFPEMKGFSERNLKYIRQWVLFYSGDQAIGQQAVAQLTQIPWGHNLKIISYCQDIEEALYYVQNTLENGWSRSVLTHQMESDLWRREGKSINNFTKTLSAPQSDLAQQTLKDPYIFDFLTLSKQHSEQAIDEQLRKEADHPAIGILLCKNKDRLIAEYAFSDVKKPIGVSEYQLTQALPAYLQSKLPSIEELENESGGEL